METSIYEKDQVKREIKKRNRTLRGEREILRTATAGNLGKRKEKHELDLQERLGGVQTEEGQRGFSGVTIWYIERL